MSDKTQKKTQLAGIGFMLLHCMIISLLVILAKILGQKGYPAIQVVFFQSFGAFILILPFAFKKYGKNLIQTKKLNLHILRALLGVISFVIYFYSLKFVNLNDARAVALFGPVISFIFGILFFKEVFDYKKITALALSLIGGAIILNPASPSFHIALFLVIVAMFMWSVIDVIIKKMSKSESTVKQLFFLTGFLSIFSIIPAVFYWKNIANSNEFYLLILTGILFLFNVMAIFLAIKNANLTTIMPFDFSGMVFTAILSYFLLGEIISLNTLIGAVVIFISSLYLIFNENKKSKELTKIAISDSARE